MTQLWIFVAFVQVKKLSGVKPTNNGKTFPAKKYTA